ncbi:MAG: response regulator, partial [bacterium]
STPFRIGKIEAEIGKLLKGIQRRRVLLIDDNPEFLNSSRDCLEADNNVVSVANNFAEAVELLESQEFDLVITDLRLPDGNGIDLYRRVKRKNPDLPVILITAYLTPGVLEEIKQSGVTRFMPKPIDFTALEATFTILQPVA